MAVIRKVSLVDQVYDRLREDIVSLEIPTGSRVNVNELRDRLGVSSTPLREAINRLQQEGLIEYENNVGARVISLTRKDVEDIQQLAVTLHCAAARLTMEHADRQAVAAELEKWADAFEAAETPGEQVAAVHRFVGTFYHNCGNNRLDRSMLAIQGQQLLLRHLYANSNPDKAQDLQDYRRIAAAVSANDLPTVWTVLMENARRIQETVASTIPE